MNRKRFGMILVVEAVLCVAAAVLRTEAGTVSWNADSWNAVTFPFQQAGEILRSMSLAGGIGNAAAIFLYALLGLLPCLYLASRLFRRNAGAEDGLLAVLSLLLFGGLFLYVNPALFALLVPMAGIAEGGQLMISSCIWAVLAGYLVLRALRSFERPGEEKKVLRQLIFLLRCVGILLVFQICFIAVGNTWETMEAVRASNTGAALRQLRVTETVIVLQLLKDFADALLGLRVLGCGEGLLTALAVDRYSQQTEKWAQKLYKAAKEKVLAGVLLCVGLNLLQLLLGRWLLQADYVVQLPLGSMVLTLAVMVAAKYLAEGRALKQENDLFI